MNLTNQLLNYIPCPDCTHHTCDLANINLCEVCKIYLYHLQAYRTKCLTVRKILRVYEIIVTFLRSR